MKGNDTFGTRLWHARKSKKMTQRELASIIGAKHNSVSDWENDKNMPDPDTIVAICEALDVKADYLLIKPTPHDKLNLQNFSNGASALSDEAMNVAKAYDMMSDYGKSIIAFVVAQEEKQRKESFGKSKIMCGGTESFPSITSVTGFPVGHPAAAQAWYNAMQEQKELKQEETLCDS